VDGDTLDVDTTRVRLFVIDAPETVSGERIYHLPWQSIYDKMVVTEAQGGRWFCDECEAERAGWRRAR
jgi:endonuclease YncB( thermonuclease family)